MLSDIYSDILSRIISGIYCDILSDMGTAGPQPLSSGAPGWAVPTEIWNSRMMPGSAHWDWSSRLRSGNAHWHLELVVKVRQCPLWSGLQSRSRKRVGFWTHFHIFPCYLQHFWAFHLSCACYVQHLCFLSMATCLSTCWFLISFPYISMLFAAFLSLSSLMCMLCATCVLLVDGHLFIDVLVSDLISIYFHAICSISEPFISHVHAMCNMCASCRWPLVHQRVGFWSHVRAICLSFECYLQHLCFLPKATCWSTYCFLSSCSVHKPHRWHNSFWVPSKIAPFSSSPHCAILGICFFELCHLLVSMHKS